MWDSTHQQVFDNTKSTIAKEVVLAYPDFIIAFLSRKFTEA
jgi:hypothetical protein